VVTAHARGWDMFAYFFTFWVTPMFVFSGTFFEVTRFPWFIQVIAWALPMTHLIAVVRPLSAGLALDPLAATGHLAYVGALAAAAFAVAHYRFAKRLFD
jgi:lipooligosaccharide transport system permease protein